MFKWALKPLYVTVKGVSCPKYSHMFSKYLISSEWKSQGGDIFKNEYTKLDCNCTKMYDCLQGIFYI